MFVSLTETFACGCPGIWYPNFINSKEDFPLSGVDAFASPLLTAHCSLSLSRSPYFEIGKEATANLALAAMQPQCFWHGCCWSECISVITTKRWQTSLGMLVKLHKNTHYHKHKHIAQICVCTYTHKLFQVKFCGDFFQYVSVCVSELFAFGISESGLLQQFG